MVQPQSDYKKASPGARLRVFFPFSSFCLLLKWSNPENKWSRNSSSVVFCLFPAAAHPWPRSGATPPPARRRWSPPPGRRRSPRCARPGAHGTRGQRGRCSGRVTRSAPQKLDEFSCWFMLAPSVVRGLLVCYGSFWVLLVGDGLLAHAPKQFSTWLPCLLFGLLGGGLSVHAKATWRPYVSVHTSLSKPARKQQNAGPSFSFFWEVHQKGDRIKE